MQNFSNLNVKLFADGADLPAIQEMYARPYISGFTTNPTLMRKAGVTDYKAFAKSVLKIVPDRPVSFEVFADDFITMEKQALEIASWGNNINIKIPVTNTKGEFCGPTIKRLSENGITVNVTAIMTLEQVQAVATNLSDKTPAFVSVFAGRIADTGIDPLTIMAQSVELLKRKPLAQLIWASPRELLNISQAESIGCHILTATPDILNKLPLIGKDLSQYSLETVQMFYNDAKKSAFAL